jgi:hypothetical protein
VLSYTTSKCLSMRIEVPFGGRGPLYLEEGSSVDDSHLILD